MALRSHDPNWTKHFAVALFALGLGVTAPAEPTVVSTLGSPPGDSPTIFLPGVVSRGNVHGRLVIAPDGDEIYWTTADLTTFTTQLLSARRIDGGWSAPAPPAFARGRQAHGPLFSLDGAKLYFWTNDEAGLSAWHLDRAADGWSAPREGGLEPRGSLSLTRDGEAFYSAALETKVWGSGIFSSRLASDGTTPPNPLGPQINIEHAIDYTPFVSPDGSFLLFSSNRPTQGEKEDMHVYVTFRAASDEWSEPARVSEIQARFPTLSPDGQILFFCGDDGNVYWVQATILEKLRPARGAQKSSSPLG